jgi:excisionase family DNA binding protein
MTQDFTPEEVAELCRVHVSTVRRWIAQRQLQAIRLPGGSYRIPADEVSRLRMPIQAVGTVV